ncbi:hypothetical protein ACFFK0_10620 [Paenibacillus chartarius]|uniref:Glycosyltransferase 2-like domain-containing protein n=1 Tax=Paenibacillus chartarius TaxID=747481 RepID=A0ABV6DJU3_9BACL
MLGLFAILACYGAVVVLLHLCYYRIRKQSGFSKRKKSHVVLITHNNQSQIEWYVRSLYFFSSLQGRRIDTTVLDEGSTDDTLQIVERLSRKHSMNIGKSGADGEGVDEFLRLYDQDEVIVVRLQQQEDLTKWMQFQQ